VDLGVVAVVVVAEAAVEWVEAADSAAVHEAAGLAGNQPNIATM
jgi:hypothetical protein